MYYIYILYSPSSDIYYVGYTNNPEQRFHTHNYSDRLIFTSKHRPWEMVGLFECGLNRGDAMRIERLIKRKKSRTLVERLVKGERMYGEIAQLVRVPHRRD